jgi:hypothetical protein
MLNHRSNQLPDVCPKCRNSFLVAFRRNQRYRCSWGKKEKAGDIIVKKRMAAVAKQKTEREVKVDTLLF